MGASQRDLPVPYWRFLRSWLDNPLSVGAVAPSGRPLARLLTRELLASHRVVELGPGTGTVTREILARGVERRNLVLIERSSSFADCLERSFSGVTVVCDDATAPLDAEELRSGSFDAVVSGLPLVLFDRQQKSRLLESCLGWLNGRGAIYQFTYGGRCPLDRRLLHEHGLVAQSVGFIALNMPPAFVYRISRK